MTTQQPPETYPQPTLDLAVAALTPLRQRRPRACHLPSLLSQAMTAGSACKSAAPSRPEAALKSRLCSHRLLMPSAQGLSKSGRGAISLHITDADGDRHSRLK